MMDKKKIEFSKILLIQESVLIWIMSLTFLILAFVCIYQGYVGSLPWLSSMVAFPWTAYGVSQAFYYKKSTVENSKDGVRFESVMAEVQRSIPQVVNCQEVIEEELNINYGI
jgi:positive regulator of sigma E activity